MSAEKSFDPPDTAAKAFNALAAPTSTKVDLDAAFKDVDLDRLAEIRARIAAERAARAANRDGKHYDGHNQRVAAVLKAHMEKDPDRAYSYHELEIAAELAGIKYSNVGPATSYMVRAGIVERVGKGAYKLIRNSGDGR
jgi:hypothetical protein